jgi:hypothetical protein
MTDNWRSSEAEGQILPIPLYEAMCGAKVLCRGFESLQFLF